MNKLAYAKLAMVLVVAAGACGRVALLSSPDADGEGGVVGSSGHSGSGGRGGGGAAGSGGTVLLRLPDGGISALLGDSGILGGILDAPRDSMLGQILCGPEVKLGARCSTDTTPCLLPSLGGACTCVSGNYLCPFDSTSGPQACPSAAKTGASCSSPLAVCIGGGANACLCAGTYICF
jgi:hypothetical protein